MAEEFKTLGRYLIKSEVGRGGFAIVYRALDPSLDREVALKVMHPSLLNDPTFTQRFRREAKALAALRHPGIITVYEVSEADGRLFIAMELVDGPNLSRFIQQHGSLPWPETLSLMKPITTALDYAHSQGVVHRDLKPANILVDRVRGPLLTDFGLARLLSSTGSSVSVSMSGGILGTPAYIPPELWEMEAAGPPADVYALGCIVYEMLTGQILFGGETPMQILRAHDRGPQFTSAWPEGVPEGVEAVLNKALARLPEERYPSAGSFWHALDDANAEASAALERARLASLAAQWRAETQNAIASREWRVAKMALGRWLAIAPGDSEALAAREEIERQQAAEQSAKAQQEAGAQGAAALEAARQESVRQESVRWEAARQQVARMKASEQDAPQPEGRAEPSHPAVEHTASKTSARREAASQIPVRGEPILLDQGVEPVSNAAEARQPARRVGPNLRKILLIAGGVGILGIIGLCLLVVSLLNSPSLSDALSEFPIATDVADPMEPAQLTGTINFWHSGLDGAMQHEILTAYSQIYPGVTVNMEYVEFDQLKEKVETAAQAGAAPSVFIGPIEWGPGFYQSGLVQDLNGMMASNVLDPLYPVALQSAWYNDALISLPFDMSGVVLMRNQQIIAEPAGDLEELIAIAQRVTHGSVTGAYWETGFFFSAPIINGLGGRLMDENGEPVFIDEEGLAYLDVLAQLRDAGIPLVNYEDTDLDQFKSGQAGWIVDGTWNIASVAEAIGRENFVIDPWPTPLSGYVVTQNIYISTAVPPEDLPAAASFAAFLVSTQVQQMLSTQQYSQNFPVLEDVQMSDSLQQMALESLAMGTPFPNLPELSEYYGPLNNVITNVLWQGQDPSAELQAAYDSIQSTLAEQRGQ